MLEESIWRTDYSVDTFQGGSFVSLVNVEDVSPALFITGVIFILLIGSFLSLGVLRLFQANKRQGFMFLALSVVSVVALIFTVNTWFA